MKRVVARLAAVACAAAACPAPRPRVAVCFYGLNRALKHTARSLLDNVWKPLDAACCDVDVYGHTWSVAELTDTASAGGERRAVALGGAAQMRALLQPLGLRAFEVDDQAAFDATANHSYYDALDRRYRGPNFRNLLRQLESLRRVDALRRRGGPHAAVVFARPDLLFLDALNASQILSLPEDAFLTPYWHRWSGLNDRLSAARPRAAALVAGRIAHARAYAATTFLRAESFLRWVARHHALEPLPLDARAQRVRATGAVADNDRCLAYCSPEKRDTCRGDCRLLVPESDRAPLAAWARKQQSRDRRRTGPRGPGRADRLQGA